MDVRGPFLLTQLKGFVMIRILISAGFFLFWLPTALAQPGGGGAPCKVPVLLNCQTISGLGGRCINETSHSCGYDPFSETWGCDPDKGIDMVDNSTYLYAAPAFYNQPGWTHWVHQNAAACGFLEVCVCHESLDYCIDTTRTAWGPGEDIIDPAVYGIPPVSDCLGGL